MCEEYARTDGIVIKKSFGRTHEGAKTPGELFNEMISEVAKDKEINVILVYSFDRFSRAGAEAMLTKAFLKSKGVYVIIATQASDPDNATGEFVENMILLFNQFENQMRRDKCIGGMVACLRRGEWSDAPPLGYDKHKEVKHVLAVDRDGELLRQAFYWKANENITDEESSSV